MKIENYSLSPEEESRIFAIYEIFKLSFPKTKISYRKEIIGIGEEGSYLFCYFSLKNGIVSVKFKNRSWLNLCDEASIRKDIESTIELFKSKKILIAGTSVQRYENSVSSAENFISEKDSYMIKDFISYMEILTSIPQDKINTSFKECSNRMKNALYNAHIFTIQDLIPITPEKIMKIPNFGRKCFRELCDFLTSLSNNKNEIEIKENKSPYEIKMEEKLQKIKLLNESKIEVFVDFSDMMLEITDECEPYHELYLDLLDHICESATLKLTNREIAIVFSRLGINENAKKLQEIGDLYLVSRERVRQILVKAMRKMERKIISNDNLLALECKKINLVTKIASFSAAKFLSFLFLQEVNEELIKFICKCYLSSDINICDFRKTLHKKISLKKQQDAIAKNSHHYNNSIYDMIAFPGRKRAITENDFARLKDVQLIYNSDYFYSYENKIYQCESYSERNLLHKFLTNHTFKSIKTQSLKVPMQDNFFTSDFQCLTHDNLLVLVEIVPIFNMCEYQNLKKFNVIKNYCEKYGFGYLIIDDHGNSYESINNENDEFSKLILAEINEFGYIKYPKYKHIYSQTNASIKHLLALVKKHNLQFSLPFSLKRA